MRRPPSTRIPIAIPVCFFLLAAPVGAHDLFLKLERYELRPHTEVSIALLNGTFESSDNVIARDRVRDARIVGPQDRASRPEASAWRDDDRTTRLDFVTGEPGTYVIGVSTRPRVIELSGEDFNEYLEHDGVLDTLERRRRAGRLGEAARERYSKHVKAVYQVGDERTKAHAATLGYPVEIVPLENPGALDPGDTLRVRILRERKPLAGQLVYASHAGHHEHDESGRHLEAVRTRSDAEGIARIELGAAGIWYVRLIHMTEVDEEDVDYESNWATLTFAVD